MPKSVNHVMLLGHLGKDAETKFTPSGGAVVSFSLATSRKWKDKAGEMREETDWHRVVSWNREKISQYLTKGRPVLVEGWLHSRSYDDKEGRKVYVTEVVAKDIVLLGAGGGNAERSREHSAPVAASVVDGDVPF